MEHDPLAGSSLHELLTEQLITLERALAFNQAITHRLARDGHTSGTWSASFPQFLSAPLSALSFSQTPTTTPRGEPRAALIDALPPAVSTGNDLRAPLLTNQSDENGDASIDELSVDDYDSHRDGAMAKDAAAKHRRLLRKSSRRNLDSLDEGAEDEDGNRRESHLIMPYKVEDLYHHKGCAQFLAKSNLFNAITMIIISLNTLWIAIDTDQNKADVLCNAPMVFQIVDNIFTFYFVSELTIRFLAFQRKIDPFKDPWFIFDMSLVSLMVWEAWIVVALYKLDGKIVGGGLMRSSAILRVFRVFRLMRVARLARLLRGLPEVMILIKGMAQALRSVVAFLCLLALVIYIFGIMFCQLLRDEPLTDGNFDHVLVAMNFLLIQVITGFDAEVMANLLEAGIFYYILFMVYVLLASMTIMNMLIGVLCQVVSDVADTEKKDAFCKDMEYKLSEIIKSIDDDGSQTISREEFNQLMRTPELMTSLVGIGVDVVAFVDYVLCCYQEVEDLTLAEFSQMVVQFCGTKSATVKDLVDMRKYVSMEMAGLEVRLNQRHDRNEHASYFW